MLMKIKEGSTDKPLEYIKFLKNEADFIWQRSETHEDNQIILMFTANPDEAIKCQDFREFFPNMSIVKFTLWNGGSDSKFGTVHISKNLMFSAEDFKRRLEYA